MANVLTAGNSSNGGTSITTDTSGTLNIVTGSGSGATAISVDTSQSTTLNSAASTAPFIAKINGTESARIDSSGNLLVGTTAVPSNTQKGIALTTTANLGRLVAATNQNNDQLAYFYSSGGLAGYITVTGTTTAYTSVSDYRLKQNAQPMVGALEKVTQLKPVTYKWNHDNSDGQGFIAHELQAVIPDAVIGEKDAVDAEGNPVYQGIDTSFLVATLTAAIQEQQTMILELKAELDALKAKVGE